MQTTNNKEEQVHHGAIAARVACVHRQVDLRRQSREGRSLDHS
jgi:hypothetical protein